MKPPWIRGLRTACLVGIGVVGTHLVVVLTWGGYSVSLAGLIVASQRIRSPMILLVGLIAALALITSRPPLRELTASRRAVILFAGLFVVYMANGRTIAAGDTLPMRYLPLSLLREGNLDLDEFSFLHTSGISQSYVIPPDHALYVLRHGVNRQLPFYLEHTGRHYVSLYPVIAVVLAAPFYVLSALGPLPAEHDIFEVLEKVAGATFVAASAVFLYLALRWRTSERMAVALTLIYALGTTSLSVSSQGLWQHSPSQLALCAAFYAGVRGLIDARWLGLLGFSLAFAIVARPTDVLLAAPIGLYFIWRQPRQAHRLVLSALPPVLFQLSYNWIYFGHPLHSQLGGEAGFWSTPLVEGLAGLLVSPGRGLFVYSPIFLFASAALVASWRRQGDGLLRSLSIGVLLTILLYSKWFMWWGGQSYGPRLLADLVPALTFALYPTKAWITSSRVVKGLFVGAALWSVYAHAVGAFVDDRRWNRRVNIDQFPQHLWNWADNPLTDGSSRVVARLGRGIGLQR